MVKVANITFDERKTALPSIEIAYDISSPKYLNTTGNRCFLPITPFSNEKPYRDKERLYDIHYPTGYVDITIVRIRIPENMQIEARPASYCVTAPFGSYSQQVDIEPGLITVEQRTSIKAGTYPRKMFEEYRGFLNGRAKVFNANFVLKKQ